MATGCANCSCVASWCEARFDVERDAMEDCYLAYCFASKWPVERGWLVPLTTFFAVIFACGVFGNVATCVVIRTHRLLRTTMTNRYLFNLAIADLINIAVGLPFEVYLLWNQYPWHLPSAFCYLKGWVSETTSYASVLIILCFSVERYVAICHSFGLAALEGYRRRIPLVLPLLWLVAGACASPFAWNHRADYVVKDWPLAHVYGPVRRSRMCMLQLAFNPQLQNDYFILFHISSAVFFFIPLVIIGALYVRIGWVVRQSRRSIQTKTKDSSISANDYYSKKVLLMLVAVVVAFFCCYMPYQLQRLLFFYISDPVLQAAVNYHLFIVSGILFYLSTVINPVLYNLMSARYRQAFRETFSCSTTTKVVEQKRRTRRMSLLRPPSPRDGRRSPGGSSMGSPEPDARSRLYTATLLAPEAQL